MQERSDDAIEPFGFIRFAIPSLQRKQNRSFAVWPIPFFPRELSSSQVPQKTRICFHYSQHSPIAHWGLLVDLDVERLLHLPVFECDGVGHRLVVCGILGSRTAFGRRISGKRRTLGERSEVGK